MATSHELNKWLILVVCTVVFFLITTEVTVSSLILVDLLQVYPHHKALLSWLSGVNISLGPMCSVLFGYVITKFPLHKVGILCSAICSIAMVIAAYCNHPVILFVTFGVICGIGKGMYFIAPPTRTQRCLGDKRNLCQGIMFASHSLCFLFYPAVVRLVLDHFTWRGMILLQAGINLHAIPCYLLMAEPSSAHVPTSEVQIDIHKTNKTPPQSDSAKQKIYIDAQETERQNLRTFKQQEADDNHLNVDKQKQLDCVVKPEHKTSTLFQLFSTKPIFLPFLLGLMAIQSGNIIPFTLTPLQAVQLGTTKLKGAMLISIAAGISLVGRVVCGYVGDQNWSNPLIMGAVGGILGGTLTAIIPVLQQYDHLAVVVAALAVPSACFMSTWGGAVALVFGSHHLVYGMSFGFTAFGLGMLLPFITTGWLLEMTGKPEYMFLSFGIFEVCGGLLFLGTSMYVKMNRGQQS